MPPSSRERVDAIRRLVCERYGITKRDLLGTDRHWHFVWPRWVFVYLLDKYVPLTSTALSAVLGRTDYDVSYARKGVEREMETRYAVCMDVATLEDELRGKGYRPVPKRIPPAKDLLLRLYTHARVAA